MKVQLRVVSGITNGKEFNFTEHDVFLFGRASDSHCCLSADPYVSRHHFMLEVNPPELRLRDLGSLNGTYVNGDKYGGREENESQEDAAKRVKTVDLRDGDQIKVGDTSLTVKVANANDKELPAICFKCGKLISDKDDAARMYAGGSFMCRECRNKKKLQPPLQNKKEEYTSGDNVLDNVLNGLFGKPKQELPHIPGYEIVRRLGVGGQGMVYLVKRCSDQKELALKVMLARKKGVTEMDVKRFQREMDVCKELRHPCIVTFEDQGYENGLFYFTMEYCKGGSVHDLLSRRGGLLSVSEAFPIMLQALDGLAYAHNKGFVHRDLKPGNILLDCAGLAKVSDFGMAKNFEQAGLSGFTVAGEYGGTPPFMPKEQITDYKHVKPVSDVFSLGATFYNMLTGEYVYDFEKDAEPLRAILDDKIIPIRKRRELPTKLTEIIDRAIASDPEKRYANAGDMRKALKRAQPGGDWLSA
jgi:eukaryotic-like serine/threonine-protein kinase